MDLTADRPACEVAPVLRRRGDQLPEAAADQGKDDIAGDGRPAARRPLREAKESIKVAKYSGPPGARLGHLADGRQVADGCQRHLGILLAHRYPRGDGPSRQFLPHLAACGAE